MKITKRQLRRIIKEEKTRLLKEMMADGSVEVFAGSGITIFPDGTFKMDVLVGHQKEAVAGKLDEASILRLMDIDVIRPKFRKGKMQ